MNSILNIRFLVIFGAILISSCNQVAIEPQSYSEEEQQIIEQFAVQLVASLNNKAYALLQSSWDDGLYKKRVGALNATEKTMLDYAFENDISKSLNFMNAQVVNNVKYNGGKAYLSGVNHFEDHSTISISVQYYDLVSFLKYRVEMKENKPRLCDIYIVREDFWLSESLKKYIKFYAKYTASSEERHNANRALQNLESSILRGDTIGALIQMDNLPPVPLSDKQLAVRKLMLSVGLPGPEYAAALEEALQTQDMLYIKYFYHVYYDNASGLEEVYNGLTDQTGEKALVDSLRAGTYFWL